MQRGASRVAVGGVGGDDRLVEDGKIQRFLAQRWLLPQTCSPAFGRSLPFQDWGVTPGRDPGWSLCVAGGRGKGVPNQRFRLCTR